MSGISETMRGSRCSRFVSTLRSALILACEKGSAEVAELLLSHGADAGAVDSLGHNALHYALRTQDKELWRLLQQALNRRRRGGKSLSVLSRVSSIAKELKMFLSIPLSWRLSI